MTSPVSDPELRFMQGELAAEWYADEVLDGSGRLLYLDKVHSVSGPVEVEGSHVWDDQLLENQYRRFLNGF